MRALIALCLLLCTLQAQGRTAVVSRYAHRFAGHKTASGARYNPHALTAASRTLPFGTRVRLVNRCNGRQVVVRITDRGPFRRHRLFDLSEAAAHELGVSGLARVDYEILTR